MTICLLSNVPVWELFDFGDVTLRYRLLINILCWCLIFDGNVM